MSWSLRRVLVVGTAVAALAAAVSLPVALGQKQPPAPPVQAGGLQVVLPINPALPTTGSADAASFDLPVDTDASGEAADLLATHYMDRGDFRTAARFYSLLLTRAGGADEWTPETLFRAAYAFNQTGDKDAEAFIWQTAHARGVREIKFGDEVK